MAAAVDYNDKRYQCCCGSCHAVKGAKIICVIEIVLNALALITNLASFNLSFLVNIAALVCCALCLYGLMKYNSCMVLVGVIYHGIAMVLWIIIGVIVFIVVVLVGVILATADTNDLNTAFNQQLQERGGSTVGGAETATAFAVVMGIMSAFLVLYGLFCIWFFLVFLGAYRYMKDCERAGVSMGAQTQPGVVLAPAPQQQAYAYPQ